VHFAQVDKGSFQVKIKIMTIQTWITPCAAALLTCLLVGCGGDGFSRVPLSGTVDFEGDGSRSGFITATPESAGNGGPNVSAAIENGAFSFPADQGPVAGPYIFEVSLTVPDETSDDGGESAPGDAEETGGNTLTYSKSMAVPEGGSDSFVIELTSANTLTESGAMPASGER